MEHSDYVNPTVDGPIENQVIPEPLDESTTKASQTIVVDLVEFTNLRSSCERGERCFRSFEKPVCRGLISLTNVHVATDQVQAGLR